MIAEMFMDPVKRARIAAGGREAIAEAHAKGVSAVYEHPETREWVEELPDGTIRRMRVVAKPEGAA